MKIRIPVVGLHGINQEFTLNPMEEQFFVKVTAELFVNAITEGGVGYDDAMTSAMLNATRATAELISRR
jgi:hypothetical protein